MLQDIRESGDPGLRHGVRLFRTDRLEVGKRMHWKTYCKSERERSLVRGHPRLFMLAYRDFEMHLG